MVVPIPLRRRVTLGHTQVHTGPECRRTSGVGDQAMGGLMARAAGALSNCAAERGREERCGHRVGVTAPGVSSMAEWQIPQAEQAPVWWLCPPQDALACDAPWQARVLAASEGA